MDIVEHVAAAMRDAGSMSSYMKVEHLIDAQVRAAIKATLEHLRDNVSEGVLTEGIGERGSDGSVTEIFRTMINQALKELDA